MREDPFDRRRIADHREDTTPSPATAPQDIDQEDTGQQGGPGKPFGPAALWFDRRSRTLFRATGVRYALGISRRWWRHDLVTASGCGAEYSIVRQANARTEAKVTLGLRLSAATQRS